VPLEPEILETLRCPVGRGALRPMTRREVGRLNSELADRVARCAPGGRGCEPLEDGLAAADGTTFYRIARGVPHLIPAMRIVRTGLAASEPGTWASAVSDPWADRWAELSLRWDEMGPPVRPAHEDTEILERLASEALEAAGGVARRALMLGVTPEIAVMRWPAGARLLALDSSEAMIRNVWPARAVPHGVAALADWLAMPLHDGSYDLVVGDGSLSVPRFPEGCAALVREVRRVLRDGGVLALRMFTRPEAREPVEAVFAALRAGRIGTLDAVKWRLVMALHGDTAAGVRMGDVWDAWEANVPDAPALMRSLGWPESAHRILQGLSGLEARITFPTLPEVRALLADEFEEARCEFPGYEDGQRYPTMLLRPRSRPRPSARP